MREKVLKFYCRGCAIDYEIEEYYTHDCKLTFIDRRENARPVFRCQNCSAAFDTPWPRDDHEYGCRCKEKT